MTSSYTRLLALTRYVLLVPLLFEHVAYNTYRFPCIVPDVLGEGIQ